MTYAWAVVAVPRAAIATTAMTNIQRGKHLDGDTGTSVRDDKRNNEGRSANAKDAWVE